MYGESVRVNDVIEELLWSVLRGAGGGGGAKRKMDGVLPLKFSRHDRI